MKYEWLRPLGPPCRVRSAGIRDEIRTLDTCGEKPLPICQACIDGALLAAIDILEEV